METNSNKGAKLVIMVEPGMLEAVKYALSRVKGVINVEETEEMIK